jgi:hypothetical protein
MKNVVGVSLVVDMSLVQVLVLVGFWELSFKVKTLEIWISFV